MKKVLRVFSVLGLALLGLTAAIVIAFYLLIVVGLSPRLQTTWICSAMHTMHHKYLATVFFTDEYIDHVMKANAVDDTGYDSEILTFDRAGSDEMISESPAPAEETGTDATDEALTPTQADPPPEGDPDVEADPPGQTEEELPTDKANEDPQPGKPEEDPSPDKPEEDPQPDKSEEEPPPDKPGEDPQPATPEKEEAPEPAKEETKKEETVPPAPEKKPEKPASSGDPYLDEGYRKLEDGLYLKEVSGLTWRGYVMLVEDPRRVKVTDTSMQYECGENVMTMTKNAGAVAGINGSGFEDGPNYDSNGGSPSGLIIEDGVLVCPRVPDETIFNMIGLNRDGALVLRHCTASWALENDIVSAVSFYPFLIVNGEGLVKNGTGGWGIAPRTAVGQRVTGEFLMLVIDGRQADWSIGCDLDVLQEVLLNEGAVNAAMLDGGSSTAMVYNGEYVNRPSLGHERWINNAFVVMPGS